MLMCTLCGYKVPYSTLRVRFCPFCAPVAMPSPPKVLLRQRWFRWSNRLSDLRKYQWPAEPLCNLVVQHLTQTDVPEMLIPQTLFHLGLPVLTWCLPFAAQPKRPVPTVRAGGRCPPSSWAQSLHCWQPNTKRRKKTLHSHSQEELWLAWKCCVQQPHHHNPDRQSWSTDKPSSTRSCLGPWDNFWVPIASGKTLPSRGAKQGLIKMARDELFIKLFSHFQLC